MNQPITYMALYEEVAERLRQLIYDHRLQPGDWIDELRLADEWGISRTPLREALKVLRSEGLIVMKPRRGSFVVELSRQDLDDLYPVMALLEGRCAFEAALKMTEIDLRRLDDMHAKLEKHAVASDIDRYCEINYAFHGAVEELAGNPWLTRTAIDLRKFLKLYRRRQLQLPGRIGSSLEEHRLMMKAFHDRDPVAAEKNTYDHVINHRTALAKLEAEQGQPPSGEKSRGAPKPLLVG